MIYTNRYTHELYSRLKPGKSGRFSIQKRILPKGMLIRTYHPAGFIYHDNLSSSYPVTVLVEGEDVTHAWMSDTPFEQESYMLAVTAAHGNVLIIGLGIGLFLQMLKERNHNIDTITIVEKNEDIAKLVWRYVRTNRIKLIIQEGSEYLFCTADKYDYIYIDVWGSIYGTLAEVKQWKAIASSHLNPGGDLDYWLSALYNRVESRLNMGPVNATSMPGPHEPCLICGKKLRMDYAGLCADCADPLGLSEGFVRKV